MSWQPRVSVGDDLARLHRSARTSDMARGLGYSSLSMGEGSLDLIVGDDAENESAIRGRIGDQADGRFGVSIYYQGGLEYLPDLFTRIDAKDDQQDGRLDGHDADVDRIDQKNDDQDGRLGGLEGRMGNAEGRIGTAEGRLDGHDGTLSAHDTRISNAQTAADNARAAAAAAQATADDAGELAAAAKALAQAAKDVADAAATEEELRAWKVTTVNYIVRLNHAVRDLANELGGTDPGLPDPTPP